MDAEWDTAGGLLTDADDLFDLNAGGVDLFGEFAHCLVGVLVCERVHIDPHPCGWMDGWIDGWMKRERERELEMNARTNSSAGKNTPKWETSVFYSCHAFSLAPVNTLFLHPPLFLFTHLLQQNQCVY